MEKSKVSSKGQTVIPKAVREALGIEAGSRLIWDTRDHSIVVRVLPADPIAASVGILKDSGYSLAQFLQDRDEERRAEEAEDERLGFGLRHEPVRS